ncbi:MAG: anhydro-N-acetylmuramic acid kinase [Cytophagaceae bacterium]|jgi:anhydro-N-acetylmuramic acid kinase|nr:anhydro-N-acetylmuramic acid kinase [Cytophagaceae bacterium]
MKNAASPILAIGLMSGTSCDGLDIAYCEFSRQATGWGYKILAAKTVGYSDSFVKKLQEAAAMSGKDLMRFDREFGSFCGKAVVEFLAEYRLEAPAVVASHGHTIFHTPALGVTCQIGSGAALYAACSIPVACDFRSVDVALGGQGAPLVPIGDQLLFADYDYCLNLGGISNISFKQNDRLVAFDICPVNMALNELAALLNMPYDKDGAAAAAGKVSASMLNELNELDFYAQPAPKSLGKEWFEQSFQPVMEKYKRLSVNDRLATCSEHMAFQMAEVVRAQCLAPQHSTSPSPQKLLATGGGAFNKHLMKRFAELLKDTCTVVIPDAQTVAFKEALIFGLLGVMRIEKENNVMSSATGSSRDHCGGALYGI